MGNAPSSHKQVIGLDLLRFGAAVLVMFYHLGFWLDMEPHPIIGSGNGAVGHAMPAISAFPLAGYGWLGVQIFFVISGFVIAYTANGSSVGRFLKSRIVRLLPAAWICATITALAYLCIHLYPAGVVADAYANAVWLMPFGPWIDRVYWTLPIEVAFYLSILLLLSLDAMGKAERIFVVVGSVSATLWLAVFSLHHFQGLYHHVMPDTARVFLTIDLQQFLDNRIAQLLLFAHGCFFATGLVFWAATRRGFTPLRLAVLGFLTAGGIANVIESTRLSPRLIEPSGPAIAIYIGALAVVVLSLKFNRFMPSNRIAREIGLMTYPVYLIHNVVGCILIGHVLMRVMPLQAAAPLALVACIALVALVIRPLERRLQNRFRMAFTFATSVDWGAKIMAFARQSTTAMD